MILPGLLPLFLFFSRKPPKITCCPTLKITDACGWITATLILLNYQLVTMRS